MCNAFARLELCLTYDNVLIIIFRKCPNTKYYDIISLGGCASSVHIMQLVRIQPRKTQQVIQYRVLGALAVRQGLSVGQKECEPKCVSVKLLSLIKYKLQKSIRSSSQQTIMVISIMRDIMKVLLGSQDQASITLPIYAYLGGLNISILSSNLFTRSCKLSDRNGY